MGLSLGRRGYSSTRGKPAETRAHRPQGRQHRQRVQRRDRRHDDLRVPRRQRKVQRDELQSGDGLHRREVDSSQTLELRPRRRDAPGRRLLRGLPLPSPKAPRPLCPA